jgi:hypothetical protein
MLIGKCYLKQFIKRHVHLERDREEPSQPVQTLPEITVILNGTLAGILIMARESIENMSSQQLINRTYDTSL